MIQGLIGFTGFIAIAWLLSEKKKKVYWKMVVLGIAMQFALALLLIKVPGITIIFSYLNKLILMLENDIGFLLMRKLSKTLLFLL